MERVLISFYLFLIGKWMEVTHIKANYPRIGIVGGGQLGKMLALEAKKMGLYVTVMDPTPNCPAASVSDEQIVADYKDEAGTHELAEKSDFITFEIEIVNTSILKELEKRVVQ